MPGYRKHLTVGFCVYVMGIWALRMSGHQHSIATGVEWLLCCLAGSLFPDIDVKSKGQYYFYGILLLVLIALTACKSYVMVACLSITSYVPLLVRHRGVFHNPLFITTLSAVMWCIACTNCPRYAHVLSLDIVFFVAGALSHIWLDIGLSNGLRKYITR